MQKILIGFLGVIILGLFNACGVPKPSLDAKRQNSVFVVWKSSAMAYADQGFLYQGEDKNNLEIYSNGQAIMRLAVSKKQICTKDGCLSPDSFNSRYLSSSYPSTLLYNLLLFKPIFNAEGKQNSRVGWSQKIKKDGVYDISYVVSNNSMSFKDTINHIIIKIKKEN